MIEPFFLEGIFQNLCLWILIPFILIGVGFFFMIGKIMSEHRVAGFFVGVGCIILALWMLGLIKFW